MDTKTCFPPQNIINYFYYLKNCSSQINTVDYIIGSLGNIWVVEITQLCTEGGRDIMQVPYLGINVYYFHLKF